MPLNDLVVNISANTRDLGRGLRDATKKQRKFGRDSERMANRARGKSDLFGRLAQRVPGGAAAARGAGIGGQIAALGAVGTSLGLAAGGLTAAAAAMMAASRAATSMARTWREVGVVAARFTTVGEATISSLASQQNRLANIVQAIAAGAAERTGVPGFGGRVSGLARIGRGDIIGGFKEFIGSTFAAKLLAGAGEAAGLGPATARGRNLQQAQNAFEQRRRVTGAIERGTPEFTAALSRMVGQQSTEFQREQLLEQQKLFAELHQLRIEAAARGSKIRTDGF